MKILIVIHQPIVGKHGGFFLYTKQMISSLSKNHDISLLTICESKIENTEKIFRTDYSEIKVDYIATTLSKFMARCLSIFLSDPSYTYEISPKKILNYIQNDVFPDLIILNHYRTSWLAKRLNKLSIPMIYTTQNDEFKSLLSGSQLQKNRLVRWLAERDAYKVKKVEEEVLDLCSKSVAITTDDAISMKKRSKNATFDVIPIYIENFPATEVNVSGPIDTILLIGSFMWQLKKQNAVWFVSEVFQNLKSLFPYVKLEIVGARADLLKKFLKYRNGISIFSDVDDVSTYFRRPSIFIVPEVQEGGMKIKTIEAASNGLPIVSTSAGISGSFLEKGRSVLIADSADEMISQISLLLRDEKLRVSLGRNAAGIVRKNFSKAAIEQKWLDSINHY